MKNVHIRIDQEEIQYLTDAIERLAHDYKKGNYEGDYKIIDKLWDKLIDAKWTINGT